MPGVSEGRARESMRGGPLTRRGLPDSRPRMSLRGFFAALLLSTLLATPSAEAEWTPSAYPGASTIELRTVAAGLGATWLPALVCMATCRGVLLLWTMSSVLLTQRPT